MTRKRVAVHHDVAAALDCAVDFFSDQQRAYRLVARTEALGDRQHVGRNALLLARIAGAGAAHAAHDFVEYEQDAVAVADFADAPEIARRRGHGTQRCADHRFGDERRDAVRAEFDDLRFEFISHAQTVGFRRFVSLLVAVGIARRNVLHRSDQHRLELLAAPDVATGGQRAEGIAVIALAPRDDEFALRLPALDKILPRELQRGLDRLGAAAGQPHLVELPGRAVYEIVGQPFGGRGREKTRVRERQLVGLLPDRLPHGFVAVAEARHRGAGGRIDIALAGSVDKIGPVARDGDRQRVTEVVPIQNMRHADFLRRALSSGTYRYRAACVQSKSDGWPRALTAARRARRR